MNIPEAAVRVMMLVIAALMVVVVVVELPLKMGLPIVMRSQSVMVVTMLIVPHEYVV